jgi:hypothetical protein
MVTRLIPTEDKRIVDRQRQIENVDWSTAKMRASEGQPMCTLLFEGTRLLMDKQRIWTSPPSA